MSENNPKKLFQGKPGPGRPKGSKSRWVLRREEAAKLALENPGETPLDFLLGVMRDEDVELNIRIDCAKAAMPAMHPRLQSVKVQDDRGPMLEYTPDQLYGQLIEILLKSGAVNPQILNPIGGVTALLPSQIENKEKDSPIVWPIGRNAEDNNE